MKRKKTLVLLAIFGIFAVVFLTRFVLDDADSLDSRRARLSRLTLPDDADSLDSRRAHLSRLTLPPDGSRLYSFLLKEIPDIVSEIPCPCCGEYLDVCYKGRCPHT